jgi:hypothetical protein
MMVSAQRAQQSDVVERALCQRGLGPTAVMMVGAQSAQQSEVV